MRVTIHYEAQAKRIAGVGSETIEVAAPCKISDCIRRVADAHGDELKAILLDDAGRVHPTLLIFLEDQQIARDDDAELSDGCTLTILTPISGG